MTTDDLIAQLKAIAEMYGDASAQTGKYEGLHRLLPDDPIVRGLRFDAGMVQSNLGSRLLNAVRTLEAAGQVGMARSIHREALTNAAAASLAAMTTVLCRSRGAA